MNTSIAIALVTVALLFVFVFAGVHISFTLMSLSFVGLFLVTSNFSTALSVLSMCTASPCCRKRMDSIWRQVFFAAGKPVAMTGQHLAA